MFSQKTGWVYLHVFLLVICCAVSNLHADIPSYQNKIIECTSELVVYEQALHNAFHTFAYHSGGHVEVFQTVARQTIVSLSFPASLNCPKIKPDAEDDGGYQFALWQKALRGSPARQNDSIVALSEDGPSNHDFPLEELSFPPLSVTAMASMFKGLTSAMDTTQIPSAILQQIGVLLTDTFSSQESLYRVLPVNPHGTYKIYFLNDRKEWELLSEILFQELSEDDYHNAILALVSALSVLQSHPADQVPGISQVMFGDNAQGASGELSSQPRSKKGSDMRSQTTGQGGRGLSGGDESEKEQDKPPRNVKEFFKSHYAQQALDAVLLAIGLGLNPFSPAIESLTIGNIIQKAEQRNFLKSRFNFAMSFHNQVIAGMTGLDQWIHPVGKSKLSEVPNLFYLAQIRPLNHWFLAGYLRLPKSHITDFEQKYPNNQRWQQLHVMFLAVERGVSWEKIRSAILIAQAKAGSSIASAGVATTSETIDVAGTYTPETAVLDKKIKKLFQRIPLAGDRFDTRESRVQVLKLVISRQERSLFFAALGIPPVDAVDTHSTIAAVSRGKKNSAEFSWNHIAVALHLAGLLDIQPHIPLLKLYIDRFREIEVEPIRSSTDYHSVRKRTEELLLQITQTPVEPTNQCCVCLEENSDLVIFIPCGHKKVCKKCAEKLNNCPVCREEIKSQLDKIYE